MIKSSALPANAHPAASRGMRELPVNQTVMTHTTKSPSPPMPTCRRLSYESAQTRSNTRASSRSCSAPQPPVSMPARHGRPGTSATAPPPPHAVTAAELYRKPVEQPRSVVAKPFPPSMDANRKHNSSDGGTKAAAQATEAVENSRGPPLAKEVADTRDVLLSSPAYVRYESLTASPSPAAAPAAARSVDVLSETPSCPAAESAMYAPADSENQPPRDVSTFSCVLMAPSRSSGKTDGATSTHTASTSVEAPADDLHTPLPQAHDPMQDVMRALEAAEVAAQRNGPTATQCVSASACTPVEVVRAAQGRGNNNNNPPPPPSSSSSSSSSAHVAGGGEQQLARRVAAPAPRCNPSSNPTTRSRPFTTVAASTPSSSSSTAVPPAPTLRSGQHGPSPFAADQLAMMPPPPPRRPSPTAFAAATRGASSPEKAALRPHHRPPQVQLVRPHDLYRQPPPTAMAASQLPGGASAHSRLQLPQPSRLVRTVSSTNSQQQQQQQRRVGADGLAGRRRTPSAGAVAASPFKRRPSAASSMSGVTQRPGGAAAATSTAAATAVRSQSRLRSPSASVAYTTRNASRGRGVPPQQVEKRVTASAADVSSVASSATPLKKTSFTRGGQACASPTAHTAAARSSSAPVGRRAGRNGAGAATAAGGAVAVMGGGGGGGESEEAPAQIRANSNTALRRLPLIAADVASPSSPLRRPDTDAATSASGTSLSRTAARGGAASAGRASPGKVRRIPSVSSMPRDSAVKSAAVAANAAAAPLTRTASTAAPRVTSRAAAGGTARPTISAAGNAAYAAPTQRARPVVSTAPRRAAGGGPGYASGVTKRLPRNVDANSKSVENNTVSAAQSSMITMEESKDFLMEFQRMNQRELALFGTLLSTVANEQHQQQQQQRHSAGAASGTTEDNTKAAESGDTNSGDEKHGPVITVESAEEVSVWRCRRGASADATAVLLPPERGTAPQEATAGAADHGGHQRHHDHCSGGGEEEEEKKEAEAEVIVLVRHSRSRASSGAAPSPSRRILLDSAERQRSPSPRPSAEPPAQHTAAAVEQPLPSHSASPSPSPAPAMSGGSPLSDAYKAFPQDAPKPRTTTTVAAQTNAGVTATATAATRRTAKAAPSAAATHAAERQSTSVHSSCSRQRRRRAAPGTAAAAAPPSKAAKERPSPTRQRSVTSYTDMRSYSRHDNNCYGVTQKSGADGGGSVVVGAHAPRRSTPREYSPAFDVNGESSEERRRRDVPPLMALRRAKELAAEQAAALVQRQRERQQQQQQQAAAVVALSVGSGGETDGDAAPSQASPSMFSSCGSPAGGDGSRSSNGRPSSNCVGGPSAEVAEVRMTAAQLQLLIDGSRSRQNWERYQQL